ncbi:NAD(P)H-binding protein [Pedobacter jeongneungensis]|uniref:NmrA family NAD(P)-binding protein n=1 Tax=Pedobacter jeongneungensis TaxID=947309 RepID=UPI000468E038|nr:NAD(P)H-binding protein [Pedobacter jeongneungensis]
MYVILGASGQVGSAIVDHLLAKKLAVKAIIHNPEKTSEIKKKGAGVAVADAMDLNSLIDAFQGGDTLFVLTPETGKNKDVLGETKTILENYHKAIQQSSIKKVVGLSSIGAQYDKGTGNLLMSHMLEHAFEDLDIPQVFVRPAYYYSNWLAQLPEVKKSGTLPTFYPTDLTIPMISPMDVATFIGDVLVKDDESKIYEIVGPEKLSSDDIAKAFSVVLKKDVKAKQIPRENWDVTLQNIGFSPDARKNFIEMTETVVNGDTDPENNGTTLVELKTGISEYIENALRDKEHK